jgi:riboflavin synthase
MFTGIVCQTARIARLTPEAGGARLAVRPDAPLAGLQSGESISVSGACLTVETGSAPDLLCFFLSDETLARTTLGGLRPGGLVNLERALAAGDRLGGHLVSGHVDAVGSIEGFVPAGEGSILTVRHPRELARFFAPKGSVAVDGISLTIVESAGERFTVAVIPHTIARTTLREAAAGRPVNLEADVLARYALHGLAAMQGVNESGGSAKPGLTLEKLAEAGFETGFRSGPGPERS